MKFIALDLGARTGFAYGEAGSMPSRSGAVNLRKRGQDIEIAVRNLGCFLRDFYATDPFEFIVAEHFLNPIASKSADATIGQLRMHGCIDCFAGCYGLDVRRPNPASVRKHFIGAASANTRSTGPSTSKKKREMRAKTKDMVVGRARLLGYMDKDKYDDDLADACAIYDFASASIFRSPAARFEMFNGSAA